MKKEKICSAILAIFTIVCTLAILGGCACMFPESLHHTYLGIVWFFGSCGVAFAFEIGFIYVVKNAKYY